MDKIQYKILKYIDVHRDSKNVSIYELEREFSKKYKLTHKDITEISLNLKSHGYISYVGLAPSFITTHSGHMFIKSYKKDNISQFIKNYIYPIAITTIGCLITYYLNRH